MYLKTKKHILQLYYNNTKANTFDIALVHKKIQIIIPTDIAGLTQ